MQFHRKCFISEIVHYIKGRNTRQESHERNQQYKLQEEHSGQKELQGQRTQDGSLLGMITEQPRSQCGQRSDQGASRGLRAQEGTRSQITGHASPGKTEAFPLSLMRSGWRILSTKEAGSDSSVTGTVSKTDRWVNKGER